MTKTIRLLTAATAILVCAAGTCAAQSNYGGYQQFGLSTDLAQVLLLTQPQIDTINKMLSDLNYDWNEAITNIAILDEAIETAEDNANLPIPTIGSVASNSTVEKIVIARKIIAELATVSGTLRAQLTPAQQTTLNNIQNALQNAQAVLSLSGDGYYADLFVQTYSPTDLESISGYAVTPGVAVSANINQVIRTAVVRVRTQRATAKAEKERKSHFIPQQ